MPKTRTTRAKGTYHYAKRADGTKYRVYHNGSRGKGSYGYYNKRTPYKRSKSSSKVPKRSRSTSRGRFGNQPYSVRTKPAKITTHKDGSICVKKKEFIGDVPSSQIFMVASLPINPGVKGTFPFLSQLAENYEEWRPKKIKFVYRSTSSNAVVAMTGNSSLGVVIMATEYNVSNPPFGSKQIMEAYEGAVSKDPSLSFTHYLQTKKHHNPLDVFYVRNGTVGPGQDRKFYDLANFNIATTGMGASNRTLGELWVEYEIELLKPRLLVSDALSNNPNADHFRLPAAALAGIDTTHQFGATTGALIQPTIASTVGGRLSGGVVPAASQTRDFFVPELTLTQVADTVFSGIPTGNVADSVASTYYFPEGVQSGLYLIQYNATCTTRGSNNLVSPTYINCAPAGLFVNSSSSVMTSGANAQADNNIAFSISVTITANYASIRLPQSNTNSAANFQSCDFFVIQLPLGMSEADENPNNDDNDFVTRTEFNTFKAAVATTVNELQDEINALTTRVNDIDDDIEALQDYTEDLNSDILGLKNYVKIWEFEIGSENLKSSNDSDRVVQNGHINYIDGLWVPYRVVMQRTGDFTSPFTNLSNIQLTMYDGQAPPFTSNWYEITPGDTFWQSVDGGIYIANISNQTDLASYALNTGGYYGNQFFVESQMTGDPDNKQTLYVKIYYQLHQMQNFG